MEVCTLPGTVCELFCCGMLEVEWTLAAEARGVRFVTVLMKVDGGESVREKAFQI